jgi:hypothetical protein
MLDRVVFGIQDASSSSLARYADDLTATHRILSAEFVKKLVDINTPYKFI